MTVEVTFEDEARSLLYRADHDDGSRAIVVKELAQILEEHCAFRLAASARTAAAIQAGTDADTVALAVELDKIVDKVYAKECQAVRVFLLVMFDDRTRTVAMFKHRIDAKGMAFLASEASRVAAGEIKEEELLSSNLILPPGTRAN